MMHVEINILPGERAPRYDEGTEVSLDHVTITEQGTKGGLPIVDFVMRGPGGHLYLMVLTGRIVNSIAAAVQGVNVRNHGKADP